MQKRIRSAFFGTHEFARVILEKLSQDSHFDLVMVISQPDGRVGRKQELSASPVKRYALSRSIPVRTPEKLSKFNMEEAGTLDISIVAQYGQLIPKHILEFPRFGTINIHTSLLPKYRGASPIQSALLNGDTETGLSIMLMDEGLDTGPVLAQKKILIRSEDNAESLESKLAQLGAELLIEVLPRYMSGDLKPKTQDETKASLCAKIKREQGEVDWSLSAVEIYNRFRAFQPWPGVWSIFKGKRMKFLNMRPDTQTALPGEMFSKHDKLYIGTGTNSLEIISIQPEGKKPMDAKAFINGYRDIIDKNN